MHAQCHADGAELLAQPLLTAMGVRRHARRHVHLGRPARGGHRADLPDDRPGADHEPAAAVPQRGVEVVQAVGEEGPSVGRVEAGRVNAAVLDEQRHHLVRGPERRVQRRVVAQTQVGGEQDHGDGHDVTPEVGRREACVVPRRVTAGTARETSPVAAGVRDPGGRGYPSRMTETRPLALITGASSGIGLVT